MSDNYKSMATRDASRAETQSHLAEGNAVVVTVNISSNLQDVAAEHAAMSGMSFSALFRN